MRKYLLLGTCLALASCATQKALPHYTEAEKAAQRDAIGYWQPEPAKLDSTSGPRVEPGSHADLIRRIFEGKPPVVQLEPEATPDSLRFMKVPKPAPRRLFGLLPAKKPASPTAALGKCKGCTFNVAYGNQTNQQVGKNGQLLEQGASNTQTGKKSGDIIKADSGAIVSKVAGPGNNQTTRGNNNTPTLSAPVQQAADWRATLAKPAGYVLASLGTVVIVGGCIFLIAAYRRGKKLEA
jgi:hypothetical protein